MADDLFKEFVLDQLSPAKKGLAAFQRITRLALETPGQNEDYMKNTKHLVQWSRSAFVSALAAFLLVGCQTNSVKPCTKTTVTTTTMPVVAAPAPAVAAPVPVAPAAPIPAGSAIRIDAGATTPHTDASGNVWLADQGFADGDVVEHGDDMQIANTKDPVIYRTERWGMSSFSYKLPNGKYTVKLHFAETYDGITGPGERVFSFNVARHEFKDFDVWVKAGGPQRAYIETVNVEVTDGKLDIIFTSNIQNPEINGIEIIPGS